ncbi:MAG: hypothetical protein K8R87_13690 [Verrucomicrobia bacterium]|nr:hypothetical protein [Verrucomicrobiota bacterium]
MVEITTLDGIAARIGQRVQDGFVLGDFQFCPDENSDKFLLEGVFSCYRPAAIDAVMPASQLALKPENWRNLILKAHTDKSQGWADYTSYYRRTNGQHYWSDRAQFSHYDPDYEERMEAEAPGLAKGSLMISEVYVPRSRLEDFMAVCAADFHEHHTNVIYGTIRFIRRDDESFLAWAREDYACIVFNLRVAQGEEGVEKAKSEFRRLIDRALERGGSFFLTYHRWATREQMLKAYPQFPEFLQFKKQHDPAEVFQSEWYRHWRREFAAKQ